MKIFSSHLFKLEFKRSFKGLMVWSLSLGLTMYLVVVLYPFVIDMYAAIPAEFYDIMNSFGGIPDTIMEYFATEGAMMLQIFGAIFAVMEGFQAINRDEREKIVEGLYVLPYKREVIFFTKFVRITVNVLIFSLINSLLSLIGFWTVSESVEGSLYLLFCVLNTAMYLVIAYLGFALACLLKPNQKSMISMMIPFPLYIISVVSLLTNNSILQKMKYLTPFTFANSVEILKTDFTFEWENLILFMILTALLLVLSLFRFKKREFMV